jgi:protein-disulfide isomerase
MTTFEDFQCPFCLQYTAEQEPGIIEEFVKSGQVRLEFKHFPILGQQNESLRAARASVCMAEQDRFWDYQNKLFLVQAEAGQFENERVDVGRFSEGNLRDYAEELGADMAAYDICFSDPASLEKVQADLAEAQSYGIQGTPGFVLNGRPLAGGSPNTIDGWRTVFDQVLAEASATPTGEGSATPAGSASPEATSTTPAATATATP